MSPMETVYSILPWVVDKILTVFHGRKYPRLEFGKPQKNEYNTYFLRVEKVSGEEYAPRCSARIVSQELGIEHDTVWNIKPYPRVYDIQDHMDIPLFTMRKNSYEYTLERKETYLVFYVAEEERGFDEKEIRLEDEKDLGKHLEVVLKVGKGKPPENYRRTVSEILSEATLSKSLGDLGTRYRPFFKG